MSAAKLVSRRQESREVGDLISSITSKIQPLLADLRRHVQTCAAKYNPPPAINLDAYLLQNYSIRLSTQPGATRSWERLQRKNVVQNPLSYSWGREFLINLVVPCPFWCVSAVLHVLLAGD